MISCILIASTTATLLTSSIITNLHKYVTNGQPVKIYSCKRIQIDERGNRFIK